MLGVGRGDSLNIQDPQVLATLMNGITQIENGKNPYAPEMVLKAAQSALVARIAPCSTSTCRAAEIHAKQHA